MKMKKITVFIILMLASSQIFSQNTDSIISLITSNNVTLKTLAKKNEADSLENRTGIYLQNPEIGFNYLLATPSGIGNRTDFSFMQAFDFPTAYRYKSQIANLKNQQLQHSYKQEYKTIILQAKFICIDLIYYNLQIKEISKRYTNAEKIADAYKSKFEIGEANILEYNKAQLNKLNTAKELETFEIEKTALLNQLSGLNGNIPITFTDTAFLKNEIPTDFELWYAEIEKTNPLFTWLKLEIELSEKQEKLNSAMCLPKLKAGYMSEFTAGQSLQGISLAISIPLWENKNQIKYAKLKTEAMQNYENASKLQYYNSLKSLHAKAIELQKSIKEYETNLQVFNNSELLYQALEKGEIDLINYILEMSFYYQSYTNLLDMQRELQKTIAQMYVYD